MKSETFELLMEKANNGDVNAQYRIAKKFYYEDHDYRNAEKWLEITLKNKSLDSFTKEKALAIINSKNINNLFNSEITPYAASRITRGGNATSGTFSKYDDYK